MMAISEKCMMAMFDTTPKMHGGKFLTSHQKCMMILELFTLDSSSTVVASKKVVSTDLTCEW